MKGFRGQASTDYLGLLAVVVVLLGGAGAAMRLDVPGAVAHTVRVALCIVGGDVCRAADARAAGLEPCVVRSRAGTRRTSVTFLFLRVGDTGGYLVERRSDGSRRVVATRGRDLSASVRAGLRVGPYVDVSAGGSGGVRWASGAAWELAGEADLRELLARVHGSPAALADAGVRAVERVPPPTESFREGGEMADLSAEVTAGGVRQPLLTGGRRQALGRRVRGSLTTWYFDATHDGPRLLGGLLPEVAVQGRGGWVLEVTEDASHRATRMVLRSTLPARGDRMVEIDAALDLTRPGNAAAARDLLTLGRGPGPLALARARAVGRHLLEAGTVERRTYRLSDAPSGPDVAVDVAAFGGEHAHTVQERRLIEAEVIRPGRRARRADCLGLGPPSGQPPQFATDAPGAVFPRR